MIFNQVFNQRQQDQDSYTKGGFTLIELLITTTILVMIMLTVSALFMTFLVGNATSTVRSTLKAEGGYALGQMEFMIRNAVQIDECLPDRNYFRLTSRDGLETIFSITTVDGINQIASNSSTMTSKAVNVSNLSFDCSQQNRLKQIKVSFMLTRDASDEIINEYFASTVTVRN